MGDDEGRVVAGSLAIALREDVYEGAWMGDRRARFTASHELAHFLLHREVTLMRARDDDDKIFRDNRRPLRRFPRQERVYPLAARSENQRPCENTRGGGCLAVRPPEGAEQVRPPDQRWGWSLRIVHVRPVQSPTWLW
jgi:hypothetical protein